MLATEIFPILSNIATDNNKFSSLKTHWVTPSAIHGWISLEDLTFSLLQKKTILKYQFSGAFAIYGKR